MHVYSLDLWFSPWFFFRFTPTQHVLQNVSRQEMWGFPGKSRDSFRFRDQQGFRLGTSCLVQLNELTEGISFSSFSRVFSATEMGDLTDAVVAMTTKTRPFEERIFCVHNWRCSVTQRNPFWCLQGELTIEVGKVCRVCLAWECNPKKNSLEDIVSSEFRLSHCVVAESDPMT